MDIKFEIRKNSRGHILVRVGGSYEMHAHIKTKDTCKLLIKLIESNTLPRSKYLQGSCRRLLKDEEYMLLKQKKQQYININKGVKKR